MVENPADTLLDVNDRLPLTCSRAGTCCRDKAISLNPWELACLASAKGCTAKDFRDRYTTCGGTRLRLDSAVPATCSQYDAARGCTVYSGRPLVCRLYPLGRQRQGQTVRYMHRGSEFPCFAACPEVRELPPLTVADFLSKQGVAAGETAQDAYLDVMLELAEGALVLLLEGGLPASAARDTLARWRELAAMPDAERAATLPGPWLDMLTAPELPSRSEDPAEFVRMHFALLQAEEESLADATSDAALRERCCRQMASALLLGRSAGIDAQALMQRWSAAAQEHGAAPRT